MSTRIRAFLLVMVGIILLIAGIGASIVFIKRINNPTGAQQPLVAKSPVVVLTRDLKLGDRITATDVNLYEIPIDVVPRDAVSSLNAAIGKYVKSDTIQGEMVLQHNLANPTNNNHDLSFILSEDHVLMAFPATDLMSQDNLIQRGDVIDILATFSVTIENPSTTTTTTTATGSTTTPNEEKPPVVDFTINAFQKVSVTALVLKVVTTQNKNANTPITVGGTQKTNQNANETVETSITSYLLALDPQDALVLKHLKDLDASFDVVLRAPTSTTQFDLSPVNDKFLIELYGLGILP